MYSRVVLWLIQFLPSRWIRCWPLNKWYEVVGDKEKALAEFNMETEYIMNTKTGILFKGSPRVQ